MLTADKTDGGVPLTVNFSSAGSLDQDPGDSIRYEWDFGDGSPISEEANPTHTYTKAGQYTAVLSVIDSTGKTPSTSTTITAGNTARGDHDRAPVEGGTFQFGDKIPYLVTVTDAEDKVIDCNDVEVEFILGHDAHGHGEEEKLGCTGFLQTLEEDVFHGGNVFGVVSAVYTDRGNGAVPALTVTKQVKIRQRKQEVEHAVTAFWHVHGDEHRRRRRPAHVQPGQRGLHPLNGPFNLKNITGITFRFADATAGRVAGSALRRRASAGLLSGPDRGHGDGVPHRGGDRADLEEPVVPALARGPERAVPDVQRQHGTCCSTSTVQFEGEGVTVVKSPPVDGTVGGSVPATLSLTLGAPATFGAFTPGVAKEYTASTTANVISSAGDAALSVSPIPAP